MACRTPANIRASSVNFTIPCGPRIVDLKSLGSFGAHVHGEYVTRIGVNHFAIDGARSGHGDSRWRWWIPAEAKDQSGREANVLLPTLTTLISLERIAKIG